MVKSKGDSARYFHENFEIEFLKYSEEYNVHPLPKIVVSFFKQFISGSFECEVPLFTPFHEKPLE